MYSKLISIFHKLVIQPAKKSVRFADQLEEEQKEEEQGNEEEKEGEKRLFIPSPPTTSECMLH